MICLRSRPKAGMRSDGRGSTSSVQDLAQLEFGISRAKRAKKSRVLGGGVIKCTVSSMEMAQKHMPV